MTANANKLARPAQPGRVAAGWRIFSSHLHACWPGALGVDGPEAHRLREVPAPEMDGGNRQLILTQRGNQLCPQLTKNHGRRFIAGEMGDVDATVGRTDGLLARMVGQAGRVDPGAAESADAMIKSLKARRKQEARHFGLLSAAPSKPRKATLRSEPIPRGELPRVLNWLQSDPGLCEDGVDGVRRGLRWLPARVHCDLHRGSRQPARAAVDGRAPIEPLQPSAADRAAVPVRALRWLLCEAGGAEASDEVIPRGLQWLPQDCLPHGPTGPQETPSLISLAVEVLGAGDEERDSLCLPAGDGDDVSWPPCPLCAYSLDLTLQDHIASTKKPKCECARAHTNACAGLRARMQPPSKALAKSLAHAKSLIGA